MLTYLNKFKKTTLTGVVGVLAISAPLLVSADRDAEREALTQLVHELNLLEPLIARAEIEADPDARVQFQYQWLRRDLERIKGGIQDHVDETNFEPRSFPPIQGEYKQ